MSKDNILGRISLQPGQTLQIPSETISDIVRRLWKQKLFKNIQVDIKYLDDDKIELIFIVEENPIVVAIEYTGVKELSLDEVRKKSGLREGMILSDEILSLVRNNVLKYYELEGFFNAKLTYELITQTEGQVKLKVVISEQTRMVIEKIFFYGNTAFQGSELEWHLGETVTNNWWRNIFGRPRFKKEQFDKDKDILISFYKERGYRDIRIIKDSVSFSNDNEKIEIHIWLEEGPKYTIRNISWEGNHLYSSHVLSDILSIKKGDVYNAKLITERMSNPQEANISSLYSDRGYMTFRYDSQEKVLEGDSIDIKFFISEGDVFRIRHVNFEGNTRTKDHVIRRAIYLYPGDVFSRENIIRSIREIAQTNYFDPEKIIPNINPLIESKEVDISFGLTEKSSDTFNASIGWGPSLGITGSIGLSFKNFSAGDFFTWKGFYGDGQIIELKVDLGQYYGYRTFSASFTEPWAFGTPLSLSGGAYYTYYIISTSTQSYQVIGVSTSVGRRLPWPDDTFTASITLRYQYLCGSITNFGVNRNITQASEFSIIASISRNSVANPIYPRGGSEYTWTGQISGGPFLPGEISFWKTTFTAKIYQRIIGDLVFVSGGEFGFLNKFKDNDIVSYVDYFHMGGGGLSTIKTIPLRGYPDQNVGPINPEFSTNSYRDYSGKTYLKFSGELRHPIILNQSVSAYAVGFFEFGNVWSDVSAVNLTDLKKSIGFGLRIFLPIVGMLGLDYAYGFDKIPANPGDNNQGWRFVFTFGPFARAIAVWQVAYNVNDMAPSEFVGGIATRIIVLELAPVLTGIIVAGRVGASVAAELSSMKITEQLDALTVMGLHPYRYLAMPRLVASMLMMPVMVVFAILVAILGAFIASVGAFDITPTEFVKASRSFFFINDLLGGLTKSIAFGLLTATTGCYAGFNASLGSQGVGAATVKRNDATPAGNDATPAGNATTPAGVAVTYAGVAVTYAGVAVTPAGVAVTYAGVAVTPTGVAITPAGVAITPCLERVIERT
ncbi:hypothetical protein CHS0354_024152 [Potamilus streckersoni]|uniref:POTRA domain-containing protein n=1 Tax=Potamilus streckersoni TaxID=2493646 RepID=A0AAE0VLE9_9BIVA|nr:hypothetical protein CHS0354_024152 [Potamilus streckersoni]